MKTSEKEFLPEVLISDFDRLYADPDTDLPDSDILAARRSKVKVADKLQQMKAKLPC